MKHNRDGKMRQIFVGVSKTQVPYRQASAGRCYRLINDKEANNGIENWKDKR